MSDIKKIIHIDMDAFYASVEQRDFPEYRGKPIAVGGSPEGRGVVATCSYEARKFGIHSAMPSSKARHLCPHLIFVAPRFDVYKKVSGQIRAILTEYTEKIEPLSLDEAYLDVTKNKKNHPSAYILAKSIKQQIKQKTGLIASAGVSYCKFLAKLASDEDKPDGLYLVTPTQASDYIDNLEIGAFHGIGKATTQKMKNLGVETGRELKQLSKYELVEHFGKQGLFFYNIARGIDKRAVKPHRERKSIGKERTFLQDVMDIGWMEVFMRKLSERVATAMLKRNLKGKTVTIKIRYADFETITRSRTIASSLNNSDEISSLGIELLRTSIEKGRGVRLLGITVSGFEKNREQEYKQLCFTFVRGS